MPCILMRRRSGKTWQEVADNLADTKYLGYQMAPGSICRFIARIKRRPYPIGAEPLTPTPHPPAKSGNNPQENTSRILERIRERARSKGQSDPVPSEDSSWSQPFEPEKL
jgi:hypothetical protein